MNAPNAYKACARCGLVRITRSDRGLYCRDCCRIASPNSSAWMAEGACRSRNFNAEWWWPSGGHDPSSAIAQLICRYCKVREQCLQFAIDHREHDGIWGGLMPEQRRQLRNTQRKAS